MNELEQRIAKIKTMLINSPLYRDYIRLQEKIDQSNFREVEEQLKLMQQEMTIALDENKLELHYEIVEKYKKMKNEFDNHPLYVNYINTKRELNELIQEMVTILKF